MKYATTYKTDFKTRLSIYFDTSSSELETIDNFFEKYIKVWDADNCGDVECDFVFENKKCYRLIYEWSLNIYRKDDNEDWIIDNIYITEISFDKCKVVNKEFRDWIL